MSALQTGTVVIDGRLWRCVIDTDTSDGVVVGVQPQETGGMVLIPARAWHTVPVGSVTMGGAR